MKLKIFTLLFVTVLLTGCGQKTEGIPGVEDMAENMLTETAKDTRTEESMGTEKNAEYEASQETEAEEEPYILTFEASTIEGEALTSECFAESKLTMLNVWATYCSPCLSEMPELGEIAASYDTADFQIIGIISDVEENAKEETKEEAKGLIAQTGANYPHLLLNASLYNNLVGSVSAVPTTFFVNQEGEVLGYLIGAYSKEDWEEIIHELLAEME